MAENTLTETSAHTPGPWTCDVVVDDVRARPDNCIQPTYALNVHGHAWPILSSTEAWANASLIAAAPDLVGALTPSDIDQIIEAIENSVMGPTEDPELDAIWQPYIDKLNALRAAILKARGQS